MSDLSRLLEDVYRSGPATPAAPVAPSWSSDSALDDAFADWVPGPSDDAHAAERAFTGTEIEPAEPTEPAEPVDQLDQLDSLMQQAASIASDMLEDEPETKPAVKTAFETAFAIESPIEMTDEPLIEFHEPVIEFHEPVVESAPEPVAVVVPTGTWCRQDDDILPSRGHGRRGRISLKRR